MKNAISTNGSRNKYNFTWIEVVGISGGFNVNVKVEVSLNEAEIFQMEIMFVQ